MKLLWGKCHRTSQWDITIESGNGLVPSDNKPLPEAMSAQICVAIWHQQTQTQTEFYSTSIEIKSATSECKQIIWWKMKRRLNAGYEEYAYWETFIKVRPDRLQKGHLGKITWPGVLIILMTMMFVHQISQIVRQADISSCVTCR